MKTACILFLLAGLVSGCGAYVHPKDRYDISLDEPYRSHIGRQYETVNLVHLVEHNDYPNKDVLRFYGLQARGPLRKTRFINNQYPLVTGQRFVIKKVTKYSKLFEILGATYVIAVLRGGDFDGQLVVISLVRGNEGRGGDILNPEYYRPIGVY